jgi:hypothetical protein
MRGVRILKSGRKVSNKDWNERAVCPRCKIVMLDWEPMATYGEFMHPANGCPEAGSMDRRPRAVVGDTWVKESERNPNHYISGGRVAQFKRKRDRRRKNQGARQARKLKG